MLISLMEKLCSKVLWKSYAHKTYGKAMLISLMEKLCSKVLWKSYAHKSKFIVNLSGCINSSN